MISLSLSLSLSLPEHVHEYNDHIHNVRHFNGHINSDPQYG